MLAWAVQIHHLWCVEQKRRKKVVKVFISFAIVPANVARAAQNRDEWKCVAFSGANSRIRGQNLFQIQIETWVRVRCDWFKTEMIQSILCGGLIQQLTANAATSVRCPRRFATAKTKRRIAIRKMSRRNVSKTQNTTQHSTLASAYEIPRSSFISLRFRVFFHFAARCSIIYLSFFTRAHFLHRMQSE